MASTSMFRNCLPVKMKLVMVKMAKSILVIKQTNLKVCETFTVTGD